MQKIYDPLRKKEVALTPEEGVRQWCIRDVLHIGAAVPLHMMMSEVEFKRGAKVYRADVLVYDRDTKPLVAVECKREDVIIDKSVIEQVMRYNAVLNPRFILLTNGRVVLLFRREGDIFKPIDRLPKYEEMLAFCP